MDVLAASRNKAMSILLQTKLCFELFVFVALQQNTGLLCWISFEILDVWDPLRKLFAPPGVPSWLRTWEVLVWFWSLSTWVDGRWLSYGCRKLSLDQCANFGAIVCLNPGAKMLKHSAIEIWSRIPSEIKNKTCWHFFGV